MMAGNKEKLVIIGDGETAEIAYEYFTSDINYEVVAFSAEKKFMKNNALFGLPVVAFEEVEKIYSPKDYKAFVAISFTQLNRLRTRLYKLTKEKGYSVCSYVSPEAFIGKNVELGENCFVFENVSIQRGVKVGNNVIFWSGCVIGHRSTIYDNCFFSEHVALAGFCDVGENCFFGINSCVSNNLKIAKDTIIGAGSVVLQSTEEAKIYVGNPAKPLLNKSIERFITNEESI
jgi:sugar O-acyltransferase (sialic acid O-acetyltransferase NeuD family)